MDGRTHRNDRSYEADMSPSPPAKLDTNVSDKARETRSSAQERRRMIWEEQMARPTNVAHYDNTSVLLLSWDPSIDDLGVQDEV